MITTSDIRKKYPKLFSPYVEISIGRGWMHIIDDLCTTLQIWSDVHSQQVEITQVKEKFGGLRVYTLYSNEDIDYLITQAEQRAKHTCEVCGNPGTLDTKRSWIKTLCSTHSQTP